MHFQNSYMETPKTSKKQFPLDEDQLDAVNQAAMDKTTEVEMLNKIIEYQNTKIELLQLKNAEQQRVLNDNKLRLNADIENSDSSGVLHFV